MEKTLVAQIANICQARHNCFTDCSRSITASGLEFASRHDSALRILEAYLPSGSGIDCGTKIDHDRSGRNKLILTLSYMDEHGGYDGWTEHTLTIRPTFLGFDITVSGRNRNDLKDYLADVYSDVLNGPPLDEAGLYPAEQED